MPPARRPGLTRSRKGCPECRVRKIKCDEARPECSQCLKNGRACSIIDGLFRPHSLSIPDTSTSGSPTPAESVNLDRSSPINETPRGGDGFQGPMTAETLDAKPESTLSTPHSRNQQISRLPPSQERSAIGQIAPIPGSLPQYSFGESSHQDGVEVAFFLRQFADLGGQWMDICTSQGSYFSQHIVELATQSPLIRYSACAMAAKQLGQMKNWDGAVGVTPRTIQVANTLLRPDLKWDFEWYGAKYYEKAIRIMAEELSDEDSVVESHVSPGQIYDTTLGFYEFGKNEAETHAYRTIAACIMCSYEELNATMRAWSSHLYGTQKFIDPLARNLVMFENVPDLKRSQDACFWYVALNDMLGSLVLHKNTWRFGGAARSWRSSHVPFKDDGRLEWKENSRPGHHDILRILICVLSLVVSNINKHETDWTIAKRDLKLWYGILPAGFNSPATQHLPEHDGEQQNTLPAEAWFGSDTPAIAMALYHMGELLILLHERPEAHEDIVKAYNSRQRDLNYHARQILAIAHGMTGMVVRKYMVQPLYIAGRCLQTHTGDERIQVLILLRDIQESLGLATEYRVRGLIEEFDIPFDSLPRRPGNPDDVFVAYQ